MKAKTLGLVGLVTMFSFGGIGKLESQNTQEPIVYDATPGIHKIDFLGDKKSYGHVTMYVSGTFKYPGRDSEILRLYLLQKLNQNEEVEQFIREEPIFTAVIIKKEIHFYTRKYECGPPYENYAGKKFRLKLVSENTGELISKKEGFFPSLEQLSSLEDIEDFYERKK